MKILATCLLMFCSSLLVGPQDPVRTPKPLPDMGHELFYAVLEGLYADGVRNETVDRILATEDGEWLHFVPGCPTCIYVLEAFRHYRARPEFVSFKGGGNTWGAGLPDAERRAFASDDLRVRLKALQRLVDDWVDRRMDRLRLTDGERARWHEHLLERSKKGEEILHSLQRSGRMKAWRDVTCPSCVGASDGSMPGTGR
ncbi:MAG: hypothetical protein KAI24_24130 [Planctomycetes bacterium]|nr:hypothetical protein [Planctomycetota bacterium]